MKIYGPTIAQMSKDADGRKKRLTQIPPGVLVMAGTSSIALQFIIEVFGLFSFQDRKDQPEKHTRDYSDWTALADDRFLLKWTKQKLHKARTFWIANGVLVERGSDWFINESAIVGARFFDYEYKSTKKKESSPSVEIPAPLAADPVSNAHDDQMKQPRTNAHDAQMFTPVSNAHGAQMKQPAEIKQLPESQSVAFNPPTETHQPEPVESELSAKIAASLKRISEPGYIRKQLAQYDETEEIEEIEVQPAPVATVERKQRTIEELFFSSWGSPEPEPEPESEPDVDDGEQW